MSLEVGMGNLRQAQSADNESISEDPIFAGVETEHITMGGEIDRDDFDDQSVKPTVIRRRTRLRNRVRGIVTYLTFYEEGFLNVRENIRKKFNKEHLLELRFIEPEPVTMRRLDTTCLWLAMSFGTIALFVSFVLPLTKLTQYTFSSVTVLATLAVVSALTFIYRSEVTYRFYTTSGQIEVMSLIASFGCSRRTAAIVREIRKAIVHADSETGVHDVRYLRAEMQAHYKLAETGVITREACSDGTTLILSKFE